MNRKPLSGQKTESDNAAHNALKYGDALVSTGVWKLDKRAEVAQSS